MKQCPFLLTLVPCPLQATAYELYIQRKIFDVYNNCRYPQQADLMCLRIHKPSEQSHTSKFIVYICVVTNLSNNCPEKTSASAYCAYVTLHSLLFVNSKHQASIFSQVTTTRLTLGPWAPKRWLSVLTWLKTACNANNLKVRGVGL